MNPCEHYECDRKRHGMGLCKTHYNAAVRRREALDPEASRINRLLYRQRYIQKQIPAAIVKLDALIEEAKSYGMSLEREARVLLELIYGNANPGQAAELEYQKAKRREVK